MSETEKVLVGTGRDSCEEELRCSTRKGGGVAFTRFDGGARGASSKSSLHSLFVEVVAVVVIKASLMADWMVEHMNSWRHLTSRDGREEADFCSWRGRGMGPLP